MTLQTQQRCLDHSLVASVSQVLDDAGIASILWGNYLLTVFGVPTIAEVRMRQNLTTHEPVLIHRRMHLL